MCTHVYDVALCSNTEKKVALSLWLVGHPCPMYSPSHLSLTSWLLVSHQVSCVSVACFLCPVFPLFDLLLLRPQHEKDANGPEEQTGSDLTISTFEKKRTTSCFDKTDTPELGGCERLVDWYVDNFRLIQIDASFDMLLSTWTYVHKWELYYWVSSVKWNIHLACWFWLQNHWLLAAAVYCKNYPI